MRLPADCVRFSHGAPTTDSYLGTVDQWKDAEQALRTAARQVLTTDSPPVIEAAGEAAFYGHHGTWIQPAWPMAFKLIEAAQTRWRAVNAPHLVALVRNGTVFRKGKTPGATHRHHANAAGGIGRHRSRLTRPTNQTTATV